MDTTPSLLFSTITPVRTPLNISSETLSSDLKRGGHSLPLIGKEFDGLFSQHLIAEGIDWENGYGDLNRDALPETFQPILKRRIEIESGDKAPSYLREFKRANGLKLTCAEFYLYDNTIGLIRLDFTLNVAQDESDRLSQLASTQTDTELSMIAQAIYQQFIFPDLARHTNLLAGNLLTNEQTACNQESLFGKLEFVDECRDELLLWTGRCLIVEKEHINPIQRDKLLQWANCTEEDLFNAGDETIYIGSGNCLMLTKDIESASQSYFRAASLCQIYYAFMTLYDGVFKESLRELLSLEKLRRKGTRKSDALLTQTGRRLELLTFLKLEFAEVLRGVQGKRKILVDHFVSGWQMNELEGATSQRADFIRERLERVSEERRAAQSRTIEMILAAIGGIAVIDFALSISDTADSIRADAVPGLVDLFRWIPPDVSLLLATGFVAALALYVYYVNR